MIDWTLVTDWLLQHGIKMLIILALSLIVYFLMKRLVPRTVKPMLSRTMEGQPEVEIEKRKTTLTHLFITMGGVVRDLIAGFVIMIENQYNVGDVIRVADVAGFVEGVNLRRTLLRDLDGILHVIPNGEI